MINLDDYGDEEEIYLYSQIKALQEEYVKAIQPYVNRLVALNNLKPPKSIIMTKAEAFLMLQELKENVKP